LDAKAQAAKTQVDGASSSTVMPNGHPIGGRISQCDRALDHPKSRAADPNEKRI
jgi:hypothetical protein